MRLKQITINFTSKSGRWRTSRSLQTTVDMKSEHWRLEVKSRVEFELVISARNAGLTNAESLKTIGGFVVDSIDCVNEKNRWITIDCGKPKHWHIDYPRHGCDFRCEYAYKKATMERSTEIRCHAMTSDGDGYTLADSGQPIEFYDVGLYEMLDGETQDQWRVEYENIELLDEAHAIVRMLERMAPNAFTEYLGGEW